MSGAFSRVRRGVDHEIGARVEMIEARRYGRPRRMVTRTFAALAACFVIMVGGYAFADQWDTPAYTLYVDAGARACIEVNPSGNVIGVQGLDKGGQSVLKKVDIAGGALDAVAAFVSESKALDYGDDFVVLTVVDDGSDRSEDAPLALSDALRGVLKDSYEIVSVTPGEARAAFDMGVMPSKYSMAREAVRKIPGLDVERAVQLDYRTLKDILAGAYDR
jgi:hypothetical protein